MSVGKQCCRQTCPDLELTTDLLHLQVFFCSAHIHAKFPTNLFVYFFFRPTSIGQYNVHPSSTPIGIHRITPNHPKLPQTTIYILKYIQYRSIYTYIVYVYTYKTDLSCFLETPGIFFERLLMYFEHHIFLDKF